jgi:hypothetical protein
VQPEYLLDGFDAFGHAQQADNVLPGEDQRAHDSSR